VAVLLWCGVCRFRVRVLLVAGLLARGCALCFVLLGLLGSCVVFGFVRLRLCFLKNAVSGRFWVRALSNLCRRLAAADFSLCAPRFCACVRVLRLRVLSDFLSFRKIISVARRVGSNFFLVFGPWWRGARRVFEFFRKGLQAPPYAARVPCCCRAGVVLLCVVVCWCVCGGWCGFV